jgi:hypothetical protein
LLLSNWGQPNLRKKNRSKRKAAEAAETAKEKAARLTKKAVAQTRESWEKSKAYLSELAATHREGAVERLKELDREIGKLEAESSPLLSQCSGIAHEIFKICGICIRCFQISAPSPAADRTM